MELPPSSTFAPAKWRVDVISFVNAMSSPSWVGPAVGYDGARRLKRLKPLRKATCHADRTTDDIRPRGDCQIEKIARRPLTDLKCRRVHVGDVIGRRVILRVEDIPPDAIPIPMLVGGDESAI